MPSSAEGSVALQLDAKHTLHSSPAGGGGVGGGRRVVLSTTLDLQFRLSTPEKGAGGEPFIMGQLVQF